MFGGRIFQPAVVFLFADLIQHKMVEFVNKGLHDCLNFGKVHQDSSVGIGFALHFYLYAETVSVHTSALVSLRHIREEMRRFKSKFFGDDDCQTLFENKSSLQN